MADHVNRIIVTGAGVDSSNGIFERSVGNGWFYSTNGSHIEPTIDGWYLVDSVVKEQTYLFTDNFQTVLAAGDGVMPLPSVITE